jgi:hypothetical protein
MEQHLLLVSIDADNDEVWSHCGVRNRKNASREQDRIPPADPEAAGHIERARRLARQEIPQKKYRNLPASGQYVPGNPPALHNIPQTKMQRQPVGTQQAGCKGRQQHHDTGINEEFMRVCVGDQCDPAGGKKDRDSHQFNSKTVACPARTAD